MKTKEAIIDLWKNGYFESVRTNKQIDKKLSGDYKVSSTNLTVSLKNCKKFLRRMGMAEWRQTKPYEEVGEDDNGKKVKYFSLLDIQPKIQKASQKLFLDEHYPQAIFEAFKQVEIMVKEKSGIKGKFGAALMQEAFSANTPILRINEGLNDSDGDEQKGFMMLFAGAQIGIEDPKGHDNVEQKDPKVAMQYIAFASLLCRMVDKSTKVK